jgi:hypothetical protein
MVVLFEALLALLKMIAGNEYQVNVVDFASVADKGIILAFQCNCACRRLSYFRYPGVLELHLYSPCL